MGNPDPRRTALVLGGSGFLGGAVCRALETRAYRVVSTGRSQRGTTLGLDVSRRGAAQLLRSILHEFRPDVAVDLVAPNVSPVDRVQRVRPRMYDYGTTLVGELSRSRVIPLVHVSTENLTEQPLDAYFDFKNSAFESIGQSDLPTISIDLPRIVGPNEPRGRFVADLIAARVSNREFTIDDPWRCRDLISVELAGELVAEISHVLVDRSMPRCDLEVVAETWTLTGIADFIESVIRSGAAERELNSSRLAARGVPEGSGDSSRERGSWRRRFVVSHAFASTFPEQETLDVRSALRSAVMAARAAERGGM
jgi:nucleoside-diphosphate-sugar epimerase